MSIFVRNFSGPILTVYIIAPILGDWIHSPREPDTSFLAATTVPNNRIFLHSSEVSFFVGNPSIFFVEIDHQHHSTLFCQRYHSKGKRYRLGIRAPLPLDFERICEDVGIRLPSHTTNRGLVLFNDQIIAEDIDEYMLWDPSRSYE